MGRTSNVSEGADPSGKGQLWSNLSGSDGRASRLSLRVGSVAKYMSGVAGASLTAPVADFGKMLHNTLARKLREGGRMMEMPLTDEFARVLAQVSVVGGSA